ncbi:unnamed protein product [Oikopleura dioica]|uniref:Uncharacterized protein n=1 Tax=Oikopleura dioica TaxID=34765 RepID=E4Y1I6_OIKDI|nr:unnamed protein product [Oikopleura dioica]CBY40266.1 unnamed protein product [Oikopleura dioica]
MASVTKNADKFYKYRRRIFELIRKIYETGCYDRTLVDLIIADKKAEQTTVYHFDPREDVQSQLEESRKRTEKNAASPRPDALTFEIFINKDAKTAIILDQKNKKTFQINLPEEFQKNQSLEVSEDSLYVKL